MPVGILLRRVYVIKNGLEGSPGSSNTTLRMTVYGLLFFAENFVKRTRVTKERPVLFSRTLMSHTFI
jgi:hypothetical protein